MLHCGRRATVARHPVGGVCPGVWRLAHSLCLFCTPKKDPSLAEFASSLTLLDYAGQYTHIRYGLGTGDWCPQRLFIVEGLLR